MERTGENNEKITGGGGGGACPAKSGENERKKKKRDFSISAALNSSLMDTRLWFLRLLMCNTCVNREVPTPPLGCGHSGHRRHPRNLRAEGCLDLGASASGAGILGDSSVANCAIAFRFVSLVLLLLLLLLLLLFLAIPGCFSGIASIGQGWHIVKTARAQERKAKCRPLSI